MRCTRPGCNGNIVQGADGPICLLCSREPGVSVRVGDMPDGYHEMRREERKRAMEIPSNGKAAVVPTATNEALEGYATSVRLYLRTRDELAEARASVARLEGALVLAREAMGDAQARLSADLGLGSEEVAAKPKRATVKQSPETIAKRMATQARNRAAREAVPA